MAVFIELTTDAFRDQFAKTTAGKRNASDAQNPYGRAGSSSVRRPLRGVEVKEDTYSIIRMVQADGGEIPLIDSGGLDGTNKSYANFIIQSVQEARMEKHQIVETFGDSYIFFFGEAPRFIDVQALLINSNDFNWQAEWWANYDQYMRGTKSVELGARTYLFYDDVIVEGYMLNAMAVNTADTPFLVSLTFRLFITDYQNVSFIGTDFPLHSSVNIPDGIDVTQNLNEDQLNQLALSGGFAGVVDDFGNITSLQPVQRDLPLRGAITDNVDEWTGAPPSLSGTEDDSSLSEVDDLHNSVLSSASDFGVTEGGPDLVSDLGLSAKFSVGASIGLSASIGSSSKASFGASASASAFVGGHAGIGFSASASAGVSASSSASTSSTFATGVSVGASFGGGVGAGASTYVGGSPTCFSLVSAEGDLDTTGNSGSSSFASASVGF